MFIKDLQARQTDVEVEGEVLELSDVREFSKFGKQGKVANAIIKDGTGKVKLSLWNDQIEKVRIGDKIKIHKGYVSEFQGELQLTTGKFGTLDVTREEKVDEKPKEEKKSIADEGFSDYSDDDWGQEKELEEEDVDEVEEEKF